MSGLGFILLVILSIGSIIAAAIYGDYKAEGKWPWTKSKNGTNSGAKFG